MSQALQLVPVFEKSELKAETEKARPEVKLTLKELCHAAGVSERTVRYYIQQGLLPPPQGAGPASRYSLEHLSRLTLIRRLKAALLPLGEIKHLMSELPTSDLEEVAHEFYHELARANPLSSEAIRPLSPKGAKEKVAPELKVFVPTKIELEDAPAQPIETASISNSKQLLAGGKWNRLLISAGLELHYEEGGEHDKAQNREKLARLLDFAQQLYAD